MIRSCVHTHTHYCDGQDSPEALVQEALALGLTTLGFSGHGAADYDDAAMSTENELHYQAEIRQLQAKYENQLELLLGQEHDALAPYSSFPYEFLIESVHYIPAAGEKLCVDWSQTRTEENIRRYFGSDPYAYCQAYFRTCAAAYEKSPAQIAGHLDLVSKFNEGAPLFDEADPRYLAPAREALASAVDRGLVVELNTGAIARGYRTLPYPAPPLLQSLRDLGGQVIITSDCHSKPYLTFWFEEAAQLLRTCGFRSVLQLRASGLEEVGL